MPYLSNFRLELPWKDYFHVWNQQARIWETAKFCARKIFKPGTKIVLFGYFRVEFEKKLLSYLKSVPLNFAKCKVSCKTKKQNCLIWVFLGCSLKTNYCHIWNQHSRLFETARFHRKQENFKFETKNSLFGYF